LIGSLVLSGRVYGLVQVSVGVDGEPLARKPNMAEPEAGIVALYATLPTETSEPLVVSVPLHSWVMLWPGARVQRTVQPSTGAVPAFTVTWPWKLPGQELIVVKVALQAPLGGVDGWLEGELEGGLEGGLEGCDDGLLDDGGVTGPPGGT